MVPMPANHLPIGSTMSTVHLSSDGTYFYWIWSPASLNEKTPKGHSVFMDIFELVVRFTLSFCVFAEKFPFGFFSYWFTKDPRKLGYVQYVHSCLKIGFSFGFLWKFVWSCTTQIKPSFLKSNLATGCR